MIPPAVVARVLSTRWFDAPWSPCVLLDDELRILAANRAFAKLTEVPASRLAGRLATDVFPPNPDDPAADATAHLTRSLQDVLSTGRSTWLGFHRHDLPDRYVQGAYLHRVWMPALTPVLHHGYVVGVVHHVQDLTPTFGPGADLPRLGAVHGPEMATAVERLERQFPGTPHDMVTGVLGDSLRVVTQVLGDPDPVRASELSRLRLELLTGAPARTG